MLLNLPQLKIWSEVGPLTHWLAPQPIMYMMAALVASNTKQLQKQARASAATMAASR